MYKRVAGCAIAIVALSMLASCARGEERMTMPQNGVETSMSPNDDLASVSPALERYRRDTLHANVWKRPQLSPRDRSIVTIAALIARNQTAEQAHYLAVALDNGVRPSEISEIITHLAFYAGWGNAMAAVPIAKGVFETRGVVQADLPSASDSLLPLDQAGGGATRGPRRADRGARVAWSRGRHHRDVLFKDLWLRPALAPRDRESGDGQRTHCDRPGRPGDVSPQPRDGQWPHQRRSRRGDLAPGVLRRVALRVLGRTGGEGRLRQATALTFRSD